MNVLTIRSVFAGFEDKTVETVTQNNKAAVRHLKLLVIDAGGRRKRQAVHACGGLRYDETV
jgi:hypothetical protein